MITACFERCPGMIIFRMIAYRPRGTACQREQKKPDCQQSSEEHYILECGDVKQHIAL
jgi:hypothetical protein